LNEYSVWVVLTGVVVAAAGCGSDGGSSDGSGGSSGSSGGGSCVTADQCWEVTDPANYDIEFECDLGQGTYATSACTRASYKTKCTQVTGVSVNDGPEKDVTYVYYRTAANTDGCLGTEEDL
jgi:hypothetical protein